MPKNITTAWPKWLPTCRHARKDQGVNWWIEETEQRLPADLIRQAVWAKKEAHGTDDGQFAKGERTMHQIGG